MKRHFTCVFYDNTDFLIPSEYIVSGIYLSVPKDSKKIVFNRETLPHIFIGNLLEKEFGCVAVGTANAVIVLNARDFADDVGRQVVESTETALPATGNLALSLTGNISSYEIDLGELHVFPNGIRPRLSECGICAVRFDKEGRKQVLVSPDSLLRRFFSGGLL